MRRLSLLIAALTSTVAAELLAQSPDPHRQLLAARDTVWRAWFANDTAVLRRFIPPGAATAEGAGTMRWSDRNEIARSARRFVASGRKLVDIAFDNTTIAETPSSALVRSYYRYITDSAGRRDTVRGRATELFVRDGARWVNPYWQLEYGGVVGREIPLPDTLGANFDIADTTTKHGSLADYDALLGFWEFRFQNRSDDGSFFPSFSGHWLFERRPGGGLIEDRWRADNPTVEWGQSTYTYRTFDPARKLWEMVGTQSGGAEFATGLTWSDESNRYAVQRYGPTRIMRIRYFAIEPNHFLWRADQSTDGGRTWLRDKWTMDARRIGR